ncbi:hypothetical protein DSO57_1004748 [Entomophthora muscae]|uniref:Uncharacterized protein n=1 Tax=Entomophthora muscae TaxID=34485 RepID=A0ACC2UGZ7_9FUNG|nr:hypothetical protein DSO57_1004748 [Entomophthora muscae]
MREFKNLMNRGNQIGATKKPKKAQESQITEAYPIMLDLLQRVPKLPLTQVRKQLAHHNIWVSERMVQLCVSTEPMRIQYWGLGKTTVQ